MTWLPEKTLDAAEWSRWMWLLSGALTASAVGFEVLDYFFHVADTYTGLGFLGLVNLWIYLAVRRLAWSSPSSSDPGPPVSAAWAWLLRFLLPLDEALRWSPHLVANHATTYLVRLAMWVLPWTLIYFWQGEHLAVSVAYWIFGMPVLGLFWFLGFLRFLVWVIPEFLADWRS